VIDCVPCIEVVNLLNLLKLQSIRCIETATCHQQVHDALDNAFENDLVVTQQALFVGKSTYKKVRDIPFTIHGPLGAKAIPLVNEIHIYEKSGGTTVEIRSFLLRFLIQNKLMLFFFISLCFIVIMAVFMLKIHFMSLVLAPLTFWFVSIQILQSEAQYTKKALEDVIHSR
jgi:hypothetical protein